MESYLIKCLNRIKKELPRRLKDVKTKCDEVAVLLENGENFDEPSQEDIVLLLDPFIASAQCRVPRVVEIGLDAVNFMIEHGYFRARQSVSSSNDTFLIDQVVEVVSKCSDEFDEGVQLQVIKALLTSITSLQCEVHGASLLLAIRSCFHVHLMTKNQTIKTTAKAALTQMVNVVNQRMEVNDNGKASNIIVDNNAETCNVPGDDLRDDGPSMVTESFSSIYQKDAYLLFRALCKLSMKGSSDDTSGYNDNILLQNKILSLELLLNLLQNCGATFKTGEKFISAIRSYLCVSLLSNCTSHVAQVTGLSLQIFVALIQNFKIHLKGELEVFVSTIFFRILESENSTFEHKLRVLEVFHDICRDSKDLVELFINYDCDMEAANLFSNIVSAFAKITKSPSTSSSTRIAVEFISTSGKKSVNEDLVLRNMGVEGLQLIVKSLLTSAGLGENKIDSRISPEVRKEPNVGDESYDVGDEAANGGDGDQPIVSIVDTFDKKLKLQEEIENGILKFNLHPMKGIKYLCSVGHLKLEPKLVADFLHAYQDKLDKTMIGDLLGREREYESGFAYSVLNEYVESMDFAELKFDKAIRYFLHGFRLPGEAQKIDRIMEKFAERYYLQHKDEFASADMAFILAFSTIMLQTNLHNPAIRDDKRMTKEQFIKQNKGISADGELSDELLMEIYDRIAAEPISIVQESKKLKKEEPNSSFVVFQSVTDKKKKDAFNTERLEMVRAGEAMIRQGKKRGSVYVRNTISEESYVKPMFEVIWPPVIGVVSQILETSDEPKLIEMSLSCLHSSISLSCRLDHSAARRMMLHVLSKFTTLETVREMKPKNVSCIKLLLEIAMSEGEFLEDSWMLVLQHISQLARLQLFATGSHSDDLFFSESGNGKKSMRFNFQDRTSTPQSDPLMKLFMGPSKAEVNRLVEESNAEMVCREVDALQVDRVFLSSTNLSAGSVMHFVRSLCEVSVSEISSSSAMNSLKGKDSNYDSASPRIFSLQKLVEVADYNMHSRSRVDWAKIWKFLADHFTSVGLHENPAVSMYAIDSLKQLSIKFLQKSELSNFNFQRIFLKPFEIIISKSSNIEIKDLVLRCIDIMIRACAVNIRSGWKSIFNILEVSASQNAHEIAKLGFEMLENLLLHQFGLLLNDFVELMNTLVVFVSAAHTELSLRALNNLSKCAEYLAQGSVVPITPVLNEPHSTEVKYKIEEDAAVFRLWWPLLLGLSTHVADIRVPVRCQALDTLSHILNKYGDIFSAQTWSVIFKGVLFPMIDSAKMDGNGKTNSAFKQSWIGTMAKGVLQSCLELYFRFNSDDKDAPLLPALLTMLQGCICQENETFAKMGLDALRRLTLSNNLAYVNNQLDLVISRIQRIISSLLIFDYYDAGKISLDNHYSIHLLKSLLFMRKHTCGENSVASGLLYDGMSLQDNRIETVFGCGSLGEYIAGSNNMPSRWKIALDWGGTMYCNQYDSLIFPIDSDHPAIDWTSFSGFVSTLSIITAELLKYLQDFTRAILLELTLAQTTIIFDCLEICYWHATAFNEHLSLRMRLNAFGVVISTSKSKLPHLIDQEVISLTTMLRGLFSKYLALQNVLENDYYVYVRQSLERMCQVAINTFLTLEGISIDQGSEGSDDSDDERFGGREQLSGMVESFSKDRHTAYTHVVAILLDHIANFTIKQFEEHQHWIVSSISVLVQCSDVQVRKKVSYVLSRFVSPKYCQKNG